MFTVPVGRGKNMRMGSGEEQGKVEGGSLYGGVRAGEMPPFLSPPG